MRIAHICCGWELPGHLVIYFPAQASTWNAGDVMSVTWDTQNIAGNVEISVSREGGRDGTFETIIETTENDGIYDWIVTGPVSANCMLKIDPQSDPPKGTIQGLFAINDSVIQHTITATSENYGNINPSGEISLNEDKTFSMEPYPGYDVEDVLIDDVSVGAVSTYTFANVTVNHSIHVTFKKNADFKMGNPKREYPEGVG